MQHILALSSLFVLWLAPAASDAQQARYILETNVAVKTPHGATVCAVIARPRDAARLPALLTFTIYADTVASKREALLTAEHGYVGVVGYTRGKACSPDRIEPYVHDGKDAAALIEWIAKQPWSDGRVGLYGGSYSGFTSWAAAKHMPKALKAIMVGAPAAPGIDVPMEGNIFLSFVYPWPLFTMNNRWLDRETYNNNQRWFELYGAWYRSGRLYRELEQIDGTPNPGFATWLAHPALDDYWRSTIPQGKEYEKIDVPMLQTAGYFYGGPGAALYYYLQHTKYNPRSQHYFLIGPYDHGQAQRGVVTAAGDTLKNIAGYQTDDVAHINMVADLRYPWFDHVLKGAPRPALLKDKFNYQLPGANAWRHVPSIAAASTDRLRLHLKTDRTLTVDFKDRSNIDAPRVGGILDAVIDTSNAITLVSEPLARATEVTGLMTGRLTFTTNKRDFDFTVTAYEQLPNGQYFQLPPYMSRASHVRSLSERRLLTPGKVETLEFESGLRMVSRQMSAGSRIVLVIAIPKNPGQQINYGTGKDVSDESIADAGEPLTVRWLGSSYIELPVNVR